jgi:hypothetical protein
MFTSFYKCYKNLGSILRNIKNKSRFPTKASLVMFLGIIIGFFIPFILLFWLQTIGVNPIWIKDILILSLVIGLIIDIYHLIKAVLR